MFKKLLSIIVLICGLVFASCQSTNTTTTKFPQLQPVKDVQTSQTQISTVETGLNTSSTKISGSATLIKQTADHIAQSFPQAQPDVTTIDNQTALVQVQSQQLQQYSTLLEQARAGLDVAASKITQEEAEITTISSELDAANKATAAAIQKAQDQTQTTLKWIEVLAVVGVGVGVALCCYGQLMMGLMVAAGSATSLVLAITVSKYLNEIAIGGIALIVICVGYILYQLYLKNKAIKEVVHTTEVAKAKLDPEDRVAVFGHESIPGKAYQIQSNSTEKIVAEVRRELAPSFTHTIDDSVAKDTDAVMQENSLEETARRRLKAVARSRRSR